MSVSEPAWRIKSRPCPFYQHGRCLFADSCNFVHNVSAKLSSGACKIDSSHTLDPSMTTPPIITVDSPRSINSSHSSRFSGLLDALKDVIGEEANTLSDPPSTPCSSGLTSPVDESDIINSCSSDKEWEGNMTVDELELCSTNSVDENPSVSRDICPGNKEGDINGFREGEPTVRFSNSHNKSVSLSSGRSRPSPLNIETAMPPIFDVSDNATEDVIDSGYAESWNPHDHSPCTSPRARSSTLVLLGSPFGSPSDRIQTQVGIFGKLGLNTFGEKVPDAASDTSLDCPNDCDSPRHGPVFHPTKDIISQDWEDIAQTSPVILSSNISSTPSSQSNPAIDRIRPECRSDEQILLPSNGSDKNLSKPGLDLDLQEKTIKGLMNSIQNVPGGVPHSFAESTIVGSPAHSDQEPSPEALDKNPLSRDTTRATLENRDNKYASCGASSFQLDHTASPSSPHYSSPLELQQRFSASTPRQIHYSVRDSMWGTTTSNTDGARRMSFGWKKWGKNRTRASDPAMSHQQKPSMTRRPSDSAITANKTPGRKHTGFVSPTNCSSYGGAPLKTPLFVSPDHTTILCINNPTRISPQSSTRASMLSLSSSVSSAKYSTPDYLSPSPHPLSIPQQVSTSLPTPDATIPSPLSFMSLDLKNFSENASGSIDSYGYVDCHDSSKHGKSRFSKPRPPSLYRINEHEDSSIENPQTNGHVNHHERPELGGFRYPKKDLESSPHRVDEREDSRKGGQPPTACPIPTPTTSSASISSASVSSRSPVPSPSHAIGMPKPTLFFAIASDDASEVRKVLESGETGPNESVGPQSALEFVLTNDQLIHRAEMVKLLLSHGANASVIKKYRSRSESISSNSELRPSSRASMLEEMDPPTRYFLEKAETAERQRTTAMMRRSSFRPITRARYEIVGQDRVLEQLFKVLSIHTRQLSSTPIVVLLSGPSGHGKSILARKFGPLLGVPTHVVNMTTLRTTHDLWQSHSMDPDSQTLTTSTLVDFLMKNEGKRCVVVLDEIEKTADEKVLWSLLMPWEHGRCLTEAGHRPIDVRNVVWIGTSNVGQDLVFEYQSAREDPQDPISKEEYIELMELVRPKMSAHLGTSVVSRVTAILPFVPFTPEEKRVICFEALNALAGAEIRELSSMLVGRMVENALVNFRSEEGARSLYRGISDQLAIHLL